MTQIGFTILGNQENRKGNPIPYFRVTAQSRFSKGTKRYHAWEDYVRGVYLNTLAAILQQHREGYEALHDLSQNKPIKATKEKIHMKLLITWANKTHADSDNVFKGIADALFANDKYLVGEFDYEYGEAGKVEVTITF